MSAVDKNQAVIDYLITCPNIQNSPLYFNFVDARDNTTQILTSAEDAVMSTPYIDGSVSKRYTFTIITFKSITENAIVKTGDYANENVEDLNTVQALIDWIAEQEELRNYPNFGEACIIDSISTETNTPNLDGITTDVVPPLAMYSVNIRIDYLDISKRIWN